MKLPLIGDYQAANVLAAAGLVLATGGTWADTLRGLGLTSVEVNSGGFIPAPHLHVDGLLASASAREDYLGVYADKGMELTALNCNGNPLSPNASDVSPRPRSVSSISGRDWSARQAV